MRQVLVRIPWDGIPWGAGTIPLFGVGLLLAIWILLGRGHYGRCIESIVDGLGLIHSRPFFGS